jgi:hypothetical protein
MPSEGSSGSPVVLAVETGDRFRHYTLRVPQGSTVWRATCVSRRESRARSESRPSIWREGAAAKLSLGTHEDQKRVGHRREGPNSRRVG